MSRNNLPSILSKSFNDKCISRLFFYQCIQMSQLIYFNKCMVLQPEFLKTQWTVYCGYHFCKYTKISLVLFEGYIVLYDIFNGLPIEHLDGLQFFTIITDAPVNFFTETSLHSSLFFRTNRWVKGYLHFKGFRYICPKGLTKQYNQLLRPPAESWSSFKSSGTYLKEREVGS